MVANSFATHIAWNGCCSFLADRKLVADCGERERGKVKAESVSNSVGEHGIFWKIAAQSKRKGEREGNKASTAKQENS